MPSPTNTTPPTIGGDDTDLGVLTVTPGVWSEDRNYQWLADGVEIAGETGTSLTKSGALVGKTITVRETVTNATGSTSAVATGIGPIHSTVPVNTAAPTISGDSPPQEGLMTLTANAGTWTEDPTSLTYQWIRGASTVITGATDSAYTPVTADIGSTLKVQVTATNAAGSTTATSAATATVIPLPAPVISTPTTASIAENSAFSLALIADQPVAWSIPSGADAAKFTLANAALPGTTATLNLTARDYEGSGANNSASADNIYHVTARATAPNGQTTDVSIAVTVLDCHISKSTPDPKGQASSTSSPAVQSYAVPPGLANRVLLIGVFQLGGGSTAPGGTTVKVATDAALTNLLNVTKVLDSGDQSVSGPRSSHAELWYVLSPPNGTIYYQAQRAGSPSAPACHTNTVVMTLADCAQEAPNVVTALNSGFSATTGNYSNSITPSSDDETIVGILWTDLNAGPAVTLTPVGDMTGSLVQSSNATTQKGAIFTYEQLTGGVAQTIGFTCGGTARFGGVMAVAWRSVPHQTQDPIYYVDSVNGNDAHQGDSPATAWKTLANVEILSPCVPGTIINLKRDGYYRRVVPTDAALEAGQSIANPLNMLTLASASGASATNPCTIQAYGTGADPVIAGDLPYPNAQNAASWASASTGTADQLTSGAVALGAERLPVGTDPTNAVRTCFPCIDGIALQPSIWSKGASVSSIYAWDDSAKGSDTFAFPGVGTVQSSYTTGGAIAKDTSKVVRCSYSGGSSGTWSVDIVDPAIGAHYGAFSPVGAFLAFRSAADQTPYYRITDYDQTTGRITAQFTGSTNDGPAGDSIFYWAILTHPLDMTQVGQFSWSVGANGSSAADSVCYAIWPSGTTKTLTRYGFGAKITGNYWVIKNIVFARTSQESGVGGFCGNLLFSGDHHTWDHITVKQRWCPGVGGTDRTNLIQCVGSSTGGTWTDITLDEGKTEGGFRLSSVYGTSFTRITGRNLGRSAKYEAGNSHDNTWTDVDFCEHLAVHGNGMTEYQDAYNSTQIGFAVLGCTTPATSQTKTSASGTRGPLAQANWSQTNAKHTVKKFGYLSSARDIGISTPGNYTTATPTERCDGGGYGALWEHVIMPFPSGSSCLSIGFDGSAAYHVSDSIGTNQGSVIDRCILLNIVADTANKSLQGVTIKNCLLMSGTVAALTAAGATDGGNNTVDTTPWTGCFTVAMQQKYTLNDAGTGYVNTQVGPSTWQWTMPAWGTAFSLADSLGVTTGTYRKGRQAGKTLATVIRTSPGSTISLVSSSHDNASFVLDRGVIVNTVPMTASSYTIEILETNAAATGTNGTSHSTLVTFTGS